MSTLPTIDETEKWDTEKIIEFLGEQNLNLTESDFEFFRKQRIEGQEFLDLTQEELQGGLGLGPAKRIVKLIKKIKGKDQGK